MHVRDEFRHARPEGGEVGAALIGRELAPQQFTCHLVVEPREIGLDEAVVRLQQRGHVRPLDQADAGYHPVPVVAVQRFVHRIVEPRMGHDRFHPAVGEPVGAQPSGAASAAGGQATHYAGRHGDGRVELGDQSQRRRLKAIPRGFGVAIVQHRPGAYRTQCADHRGELQLQAGRHQRTLRGGIALQFVDRHFQVSTGTSRW